MIVRLAVEGKVRDKAVDAFVAEYVKRLSPFFEMEIAELGGEKGLDKLIKQSKPDDIFIGMDAAGRSFTSESFAGWFDIKRQRSRSLTFIIGEAAGLSSTARSNAVEFISLSGMTLSYRVSLMVLAEQIYRAMTIITGHPYHK